MSTTASPQELASSIVADPRGRLPLLQRFFAGWFHEDWYTDTPRWQDAVDDFVTSASRSTVAATLIQLRDLAAAGLDEAALGDVLLALDCALVPTGVGLNASAWIDALISRLER